LVSDDRVLASETLGHIEGRVEESAIAEVLHRLSGVGAAGVGWPTAGSNFGAPMLVDESVADTVDDHVLQVGAAYPRRLGVERTGGGRTAAA